MNKIKRGFLSLFLLVILFSFNVDASQINDSKKVFVNINGKDFTNEDYYNSIALRSGINPALSVLDLKVLQEKYKGDTRLQKIIDKNYNSFLQSQKNSHLSLKEAFALYNASNKEEYIRKSNILVSSYRQLAAVDTSYQQIFSQEEKDYIFNHRFSANRAIYQILVAPEIGLNSSEEDINKAKAKALQKAEALADEISDLASFQKVAEANSSDRLHSNGYLGTYNINQARDAGMEQAIVNAAFELENKTLSKPIETMFGYVLVYVENKSDEIKYEDVEKEVAQILYDMYLNHNYNIENYALTLFRKDNKINVLDDYLASAYANFVVEARKAYIQFVPSQYGLDQYNTQ